MNQINVLWTGGLDSTYLVVKLATTTNRVIQPYYILDENRKSVKKELNAIAAITNMLRSNGKVTATLNDIIIVKKSTLSDDSKISAAWKKLHEECVLGSQYEFLARFAKQHNDLKLFVGILWHDNGRAQKSILGKINLVEDKVDAFNYYMAERLDNGDENSYVLYENILFPVCMRHITKVEEWNELIALGFEDIAKSTWFCHNPVLGMPCGHCNPCKDALQEGMEFRVPAMGRFFGGLRAFPKRTIKILYKKTMK